MIMKKGNKKIVENFRDFRNSAEVGGGSRYGANPEESSEGLRDFMTGAHAGGSGYRYEFGQNPEEEEGEIDPNSVSSMLSFINDISNTSLNVITNNGLSDAELDKMAYVKKRIENARRELAEAYRKLQNSVRNEDF